MANILAPRGFKPVHRADGTAYNGGFTTYRLASGYATSIFTNDVVKFLTTGYINKAAAGDQMRGVAIGFYWIAADGSKVVKNYWPASTVTLNAQDAYVQVVDDPRVVFEAQFGNSTIIPARADTGATFNIYDAGGVTATGASGEGADYSTLNTSAQQFRFLDFVPRPDNDLTTAYSRGLFMPALHDFNVTTGV